MERQTASNYVAGKALASRNAGHGYFRPGVCRRYVLADAYDRHLNCSSATFLATDTDCLLDLVEKDLSVSDFAGCGAFQYCVYSCVHDVVLQHYLKFHLWQKVHAVFAAAIALFVALLSAVASHF